MKNNNKRRSSPAAGGMAFAALATSVVMLSGATVQAGERIDFANGATLDWSVTTSYGVGIRLSGQSSELLGNVNGDDGNRNFDRHALTTNRVGALAELMLRKDNYGAVLRASTFYDDVYHGSNDHDSPGTVNKFGAHDEFTSDTERFAGNRSRFLDAYVFAGFSLPNQQYLDVKAGRHMVAWGEGLFYPGVNGVQSPTDVVKSAQPGVETKEVLLPIGQISASWDINPDFGLAAYYQYEWLGNELVPVGSFLSTSDVTGPGREFLILGPGIRAVYDGTNEPRDDGQYGVRAMYRPSLGLEFGLFHVRYHDRNPAGVLLSGFGMSPISPVLPTSYEIEYFEDIKLTGVSFSTNYGATQIGGEWSYRTGAPVMVETAPGQTALTKGAGQQMQLSFIRSLGHMPWASSTTLMGEIVHVRADDAESLNGSGNIEYETASSKQTRHATAYTLQTVLSYPGVFSGWDLNIPISWAHVVDGVTPLKGTIGAGEGDKRLSVGATLKRLGNLELNTTYTNYMSNASVKYNRQLSDRDNIVFSAKYSF